MEVKDVWQAPLPSGGNLGGAVPGADPLSSQADGRLSP